MIITDWGVMAAIGTTIILGAGLFIKKVSNAKWNLIYGIPAVISLIHFLLSNRNIFMYSVYFAALLELLLVFAYRKRVARVVISVASMVCAAVPLILTMQTNAKCYASLGYKDAFTAFHEGALCITGMEGDGF